MKKIVKYIMSILFIFLGVLFFTKNINIFGATNSEELLVEFKVESKAAVELTDSTIYNGWDYDKGAALYISLKNLDVNKVYKLVITMDPVIYAPVTKLPYPSGAVTKFTKNSNLTINGVKSYAVNKFSGTITYTFNNSTDKTMQIDNFKLQLDYDKVLWHKIKNQKMNIKNEDLIKIELIEGSSNVIDCKCLKEASSSKTLDINVLSSFRMDTSTQNTHMPTAVTGRINNKIIWSLNVSSASTFGGQYFKKLTIEIEIPKYKIDGKYYYLQYDLSDFVVKCHYNTTLNENYYKVTATEEKLIFEIENFYFKNKGIMTGKFSFPQDAVFQNTEDEFTFNGNVKLYINDNVNASIANKKFTTILNTVNAAFFQKFLLDSGTVGADIKMSDYVAKLGGLGLLNIGTKSNRLKFLYLFDNDLTDEETILVSTIQLIPDYVNEEFEITYSLMTDENEMVWFDSEGNIVSEDYPGATNTWTVKITNPYITSKKSSTHRILFNRSMLIPKHQQENLYFRSIEYIHGGFDTNELHWNSDSTSSYGSAPGTFWGYIRASKANKLIYSEIKIYQETETNVFVEETKMSSIVTTKTYNSYDVPIGLTDPVVSSSAVEAGDSFTLSGTAFVVNYPYSRCNVVNNEDSPLIFAFKLPVGVKVNASGTWFANSDQTVTIPFKTPVQQVIDEEYNLWIIELEGGYEIGYASEKLGAIKNGSSISFNVEFNTALTTASSTIFFQTSTFLAAKNYKNTAGGSNKYYVATDTYDINGNGTTDNIASFHSQNHANISIQIIDKIAQLDINDNYSLNGSLTHMKEGELLKVDDVLSYELVINCVDGGTAEDFAYYIPIIKEDSIVDDELIFNKQFPYKLTEEVIVSNSLSYNGVKILYGFDSQATFKKANEGQVTWYETIPDNKTLEEVTIIKIVPKQEIIENGSVSVITVNMSYDGNESEYIKDAGMVNIWSSRGQYKYRIGDRATVGLFSTDKNIATISYTFDKQIIELTTSTGDHSDNEGNDSYIIDTLTSFKNEQTYKIVSVKTYNTVLTSVSYMEANASILTGDEANGTFAFYVTLDANEKKDVTVSENLLGTVGELQEYKLKFEIFNADVISDSITDRYIEIIIKSDNGVTIPVRINIKRTLTVIGTVSNSISAGKQYALFGTTDTSVTISKDSAFTAQFSAENIIPDNYKERKLLFTKALPEGTTIVFIDLTESTNIKYYYYEVGSLESKEISLTKFNVMGKSEKYSVLTGTTAITEKYLFIIDMADENTLAHGSENSINLIRTLNSGEEKSATALTFKTNEIRTYELEGTDNKEVGEEIEIEYTISEISYSDSKYNYRKLSLIITPTSTLSVNDASIKYNGETYYLNRNKEFIIPLNDVQISGTNKIKFIFNSKTITENEGTCTLNIKLKASATASADKPHLGNELKEINLTLKTNPKTSFKVESMSDRWIDKEELKKTIEIKYNIEGVVNKVTIELQTKIGAGYATDSTLLEAVNGSTTQSSGQFIVTGKTTLTLKFSELMPVGNYQLLFTVYDNEGNKVITIPYKFIVME